MNISRLLICICAVMASVFSASDAFSAQQARPDLTQWVLELQDEATRKGVSVEIFNKSMSGFLPDERILRSEESQPENQKDLAQYLHDVLTKDRIVYGRQMMVSRRDLLDKISRKYDVPANVLVALWAIESSYGKYMSVRKRSAISSLATLAYAGKRPAYFREELIDALLILEKESAWLGPNDFYGSWAGAIGQCQFMPSSYLKYAVDFDGDGKRNIWDSEADALASAANYLHSEGWFSDEGVSENSNNYRVLLKWNHSRNFVIAVTRLADAIGGLPE